ncbi:hypothetical protein QPK87_23035 [Kamptonema cortianum]|nr:hypothetical protein [Kamptonema cortianum]MDL5044498.1 hypothetical protein [Oscillatoria amoena NRMC-F 0135]
MPLDESREQELFICFGPQYRSNPYLSELRDLLAAFTCSKNLSQKIDSWSRINQWISKEGFAWFRDQNNQELISLTRAELHLRILENCPGLRDDYQVSLGQMLMSMRMVNVFGETGVPSHRGFLSEFTNRLARKFLPPPRDDHDFAKFLQRLRRDTGATPYFLSLTPEQFARVQNVILPNENREFLQPLVDGFADGFRLLAAKVHLHGLGADVRSKLSAGGLSESSFHRIIFSSESLMDHFQKGQHIAAAVELWRKDALGCRAELGTLRRKLEERGGVSIDTVFSIDLMETCLDRMESMIGIITESDGVTRAGLIQAMGRELLENISEDNSLLSLIRKNTSLIYRKIVERSGQLGEHYIALSKKEYWHIWIAAAGGGFLTVFTAAIKIHIYGWRLAPFLEGLAAGLNYAISFIILHACGFVLATKQPAMTAATLAKSMDNKNRNRVIREMIDIAPKVAYTQVAAAAGNILVVAVGAYIFSYLWLWTTGSFFMSDEYARHTYATLSPLDSGTVFYAALTGMILWLASLIGGWFDNWSSYHRISQGIADHRLGELVGSDKMKKVGMAYEHHNAALATNISLGLMLGMVHSLGQFFGIALDVRHVTLSTGTLALAAASLEKAWFMDGWFIRALGGIAVMFVLNLGVSFFLSLFTAMRAFRWSLRDSLELTGKLLWRFLRAPWEFILPPMSYWKKDIPPADLTGTPKPEQIASQQKDDHIKP